MVKTITGFWLKFYPHIAQTLAVGIVVVAMLIFATSIYQVFGRQAPIQMRSLDPPDLGSLCPGIPFVASVQVKVTDLAIVTYSISVMNKTMDRHLIGTQQTFVRLPYPMTGVFFQSFPWDVPNLPPGTYARVLAGIGTNGYDKPEEIINKFSIRKDCPRVKRPTSKDN